jgi:hypothetical protein
MEAGMITYPRPVSKMPTAGQYTRSGDTRLEKIIISPHLPIPVRDSRSPELQKKLSKGAPSTQLTKAPHIRHSTLQQNVSKLSHALGRKSNLNKFKRSKKYVF